MDLNYTIFFIQLVLLFLFISTSFYLLGGKKYLLSKDKDGWILDITNLFIQGTLIPILFVPILASIYSKAFPQFYQCITISNAMGFILNFILVDYLYYWNHRILHHKKLFPIHIVHHTIQKMDGLGTSRNTLWSSFFICYVWINSFFLYLIGPNSGYIIGMAISAILDIWKHSTPLPKLQPLQIYLSKYLFIMSPLDHSWHHSFKIDKNYGANLNLFDKLHKTFLYNQNNPQKLGLGTNLNLWQKLLYPIRN